MRAFSFVVLDLHDSDSKALIADGIKKSNTKKTRPFFFHHLTESMDTHVHGGRPNSYVRLGRGNDNRQIAKSIES